VSATPNVAGDEACGSSPESLRDGELNTVELLSAAVIGVWNTEVAEVASMSMGFRCGIRGEVTDPADVTVDRRNVAMLRSNSST